MPDIWYDAEILTWIILLLLKYVCKKLWLFCQNNLAWHWLFGFRINPLHSMVDRLKRNGPFISLYTPIVLLSPGFLTSTLGRHFVWHPVKSSRWDSVPASLFWAWGARPVEKLKQASGSQAPSERQSRWAQWAHVLPVQTGARQVREVPVAQQGSSPHPPPSPIPLPLHLSSLNCSTWDGKTAGLSRLSHPSCSGFGLAHMPPAPFIRRSALSQRQLYIWSTSSETSEKNDCG